MSTLFRVAAGSLNLTSLDWEGNKNKMVTTLTRFRHSMTNDMCDTSDCVTRTVPGILCLGELCLCGPGCEDMFSAPWLCDRSFEVLKSLLPHTQNMFVTFGLPVCYEGKVYKGTALVANGQLLGVHCASNLKNTGIHYEARWFTPWSGAPVQITRDGLDFVLGQSEYMFHGLRLAVADDWEECQQTPLPASQSNIDVLLVCAADAFELGRDKLIRETLLECSRIRSCCVVFANLVGNESGAVIHDGGSLIAIQGELVARNKRFSYNDVSICSASLVSSSDRQIHVSGPVCNDLIETWESSANVCFEEFARSVPLGLFDYLRKSRSNGFALSLSGGADSASIAVMVRLMVHFGLKHADFAEKLRYIPNVNKFLSCDASAGAEAEQKLVEQLLVTIYQATCNSSSVTRQAAAEVAQFTGAKHYECNIDQIVKAYETMISNAVGRSLDWKTDDLALQNVQARTRAPGVWLLANLDNRLLLSTGNRSEVACGYATMDGDTCGSLSPISGIDKAFLRQWLQWMEHKGPESFQPCPVLGLINKQQPTAELRPGEAHQTDETDLMPYAVLNLFEAALIRDRLSAKAALIRVENEGRTQGWSFSHEDYSAWLKKFLARWNVSQWKRQRGAVGFHLDQYDLSPGSWCRFPILSGGLQE